jgi:hypothetical protein
MLIVAFINYKTLKLSMQTFTPNDLLLYVFNECSEEQSLLIQKEMAFNPELKNELEILQASTQEVTALAFSPNPYVMDKIFAQLHLENKLLIV